MFIYYYYYFSLISFCPLPLSELLVNEFVGKALAANSDALQNTVAAELVKDKVGVDESGLLQLVGDDAAHKVRHCVPERCHEVAQRRLVELGHGHKLTALLPLAVLALLTLVVSPQARDEWLCGLAEQLHHRIVQRVFVLVEPPLDRVADLQGSSGDGKLSKMKWELRRAEVEIIRGRLTNVNRK